MEISLTSNAIRETLVLQTSSLKKLEIIKNDMSLSPQEQSQLLDDLKMEHKIKFKNIQETYQKETESIALQKDNETINQLFTSIY